MMNPNPGYLAGLAKTSELRKSAVAAKGSKQRRTEQRLTALQAVAAARGSAKDLFEVWSSKGAKAKDFAFALVFSEPDHLGKVAKDGVVVFDPLDANADSSDLKTINAHKNHVAVGFVICWLDRTKKDFVAHARPLLIDPASLTLLEKLVDEVASLKDWRLQ